MVVGENVEHAKPRKEGPMTVTETGEDGAHRIIESLQAAEQSALEAVRKFLDTVDGVFPDLSKDGPRRKIIDSAFNMTEQLVSTSTRLAQNILEVTEKSLTESDQKSTSSGK